MAQDKHSEKSTCFRVAIDCIDQNARDAGCTPPRHGCWTEEDSIPEWNVDSVRELAHQYLSDGTSTCYCAELHLSE